MAEPVITNIEPKTPAGNESPHDGLLLPRLARLDAGKNPLTSWTPSLEEERRIFRVWKGFTLAERTKDTVSWIWDYGVEIQSEASRRWICMPCVRQKTSSPVIRIERHTECRAPPLEVSRLLGSVRTTTNATADERGEESLRIYHRPHGTQTFGA